MGKIKLEGAIELHCHYGPDFIQRTTPSSMRSLRCRRRRRPPKPGWPRSCSSRTTSPRAALAYTINQTVTGVRTFGGITLDHQVGGLNPFAVEHALRLGAKIVWLPTVASHQDYLNGLGPRLGYPGTGIRTTGDDGNLLPVVREILDLVAEHDAVIATGHITADEHFAVARAFATAWASNRDPCG